MSKTLGFHARHLFDETTLRACLATMEGSPGKIRLSTLPDDIVFRIMSFLTMRQAVRMCVLSRRWRNLWRTVPCINADISEFKRRDTEHYDQETELAFKMFMERLNELRDPAPLIHTFRFRCILDLNEEINHILDSEVINGWISHAVQKQPHFLDIALLCDKLELNHSAFNCRYLRRIEFTNVILMQGFFKQLEMGCPAMRGLFLDECSVEDIEISSHTLKVLTIKNTHVSYGNKTTISTPSVTYLKLLSPLNGTYVLNDMPLLVTSLLVLYHVQDSGDFFQNLRSLSAAKSLEFDYVGRRKKLTIENNLQLYPKFNNLVSLTLGQWCLDANFYGLTVFLQTSPKLEKLTLKLEKEKPQRIIGKLEDRSFTCEHLTRVEVVCSEDDPLVEDVVNFFVNSGLTSAQDDPLVKDVVNFFVNSGLTSAQVHIITFVAPVESESTYKHQQQEEEEEEEERFHARHLFDETPACAVSRFHARHLFDETPLRACSAAMEGSPSKSRGVTAPAHTDDGDWFSDVPDDIILNIMSFLTTRQAVQTCVLSRRWRNLWRSVPCINSDIDEFTRDSDSEGYYDEKTELAFIMFMERVMELRDPAALISTFQFRCKFELDEGFDDISDPEDINAWISHAVQKQARVLDIVVLCDKLYLDHSEFASRYLTRIEFTSVVLMEGFFKQLEMGCPAWESLFLDECAVNDVEISSQTLKVLTIKNTLFSSDKTTISTPSVTYLKLWRPVDSCVFNDMPLLVTSLLVLYHVQDSGDFFQNLRSLSAAKSLEFNYIGKELTMENNFQLYPKFNNLVRLTLGQWCLDANFYGLMVFLQTSPKLEKLTLKIEKEKTQRIIGKIEDRSFTCEHLTPVEIVCSEDDPLVKDVVTFFVNSGLTSAQVHIIRRISHALHLFDETPARAVSSFYARHLFDETPLRACSAAMEGSPSKRRGVTAPAHTDDGDWFSDVPDDVILNIMSFLTTRQAVQTCVLSRRWLNLWRSVPCINADVGEFQRSDTEWEEYDQERESAFKMFMDRVLELRNPAAPIRTFRFRCCRLDGFEGTSDEADMNRWITHAMQKQPWVLDILVLYDALKLDHSAFTCRYLTRIKFINVLMMPGFFQQLEMGCPVLENLFLDESIVADVEISSRTLKVLTIKSTQFSYKFRTTISTPSVTYLKLWRPVNGIYVFNDMPLLVTSILVLYNVQDSSDFCQNLRSLSAAKRLEFDYFGRKLTMENNLQLYPKFNNLVSLTLGQWCLDANFYGLVVFLQNAPKLEKLTLELEKNTPERIIGKLEDRSFTCEHLTRVEVVCSEGDPLVKDVVNFFVNSGLTSAQVQIIRWRDGPTRGLSTHATCSTKRLWACACAHGLTAMAPAHADGKDWFSALPDDIVLHIMTFLTTRQAVRTCVLSRRWRNLWRTVPCINIHIHEFGRNETGFIKYDQKMELSFNSFLDKVLKLRDPAASIRTFCFKFYRLTRIEEAYARVLDIVVLSGKLELNHYSAFACRFLTAINFVSVAMKQGFFKQLEKGCPSLENLSLDECIITLKVLSIIDTWFPWKYKTTISTPSVTIFSLWWPLSGTIVFNNMPLLVNSLLVLHVEQASSDFCQNLRSLSAAKNLTCQFYYDGKKLTIENNLQRYPKFINLVSLTLGQWCLDANFYGLIVFLRNSPILEKLNLELEKHRWGKTSQRMIGELEERSFTCEHLTTPHAHHLFDEMPLRARPPMENAAGRDRLSDLPDEILHRIMSFLNARQAVQTCVLSRRWCNLWHTVPCINADFVEFDSIGYQGPEVPFKRFVNRLLEFRDPASVIDTFLLKYAMPDRLDGYKASNEEANRWIGHALQKQARILEVAVFFFPLDLDHSVFTSCYLRRIEFSHVYLRKGFFEQIETGCPSLEDLLLHQCFIWDGEISSQTLKVLTVDATELYTVKEMSISTPNLTSLTLSGLEYPKAVLKDMPLLVTASVSVTFDALNFDGYYDANDLRQYLWGLSAVRNLEFHYEGAELMIANNSQWCPEFVDVVNLTLGEWCLDANFHALIVFLQNSPRLVKLTLKLAKDRWTTPQRIIGELEERSFTCEHLKIVEVICLENDPQVIGVEDFFVRSGMTSVQFHIKHWRKDEEYELPAFIHFPHPHAHQLFDEMPPRALPPVEDDAGRDWLGDLPEEVLHHIMSFLDARLAVRTCVLSRRWRNLWRTVPCINADFDEFDLVFYQGDDEDYDDVLAFKRFVNCLLELRDPTAMTDTFWLRYTTRPEGNTYSNEDAYGWISHALQKQARVLEVVVFCCLFELDHSVFTSCYLRRIAFSGIVLCKGFFAQLEAGCPALEDLFLHQCGVHDDEISSHTLKVLTFDSVFFYMPMDTVEFTLLNKTSISLPSVTSLTISTSEGFTPILKDTASLVTASVSVSVTMSSFRFRFDANDLGQYLQSLSGVTNLEFNYQGSKLTIENHLQWCPEFLNVVNLTLGQWCMDSNFYALIVFLQNSPRLKSNMRISRRIIGELTEISFTCEHLNTVEVICSENDPQVITVQDFFVSSGMTSVQFHIKHWSPYANDLPAFIRSI
uniref:F-box domain-containing protein n=1 Tax=Oryza glumipatula TaxID=40148 RepID=A0A0E0B7H5_9ORYZ